MPTTRVVLETDEISRALTRIAHEILERNRGAGDLVLLGIPRRGVPLAQRLASRIAQADARSSDLTDAPAAALRH